MKKIFLTLSLLIATTGASIANDEFNDGLLENMDIKTFVSTLNDIEGYFFVGTDEVRDLSLTLSRPDDSAEKEDYAAWTWKSMNPSIASMFRGEENAPMLTGVAYGETIISGTEIKDDGTTDNHNFVVFVCPKITIVSPQGAIYSYHKVYNQNTRIQFTQSKEYSINAVLRIDAVHPEGLDITKDIHEDGWYESTDQITGDTVFWVTMEENKEGDETTATGSSAIRILVNEHLLTLTSDSKDEKVKDVLEGNFEITNMWDTPLHQGTWPVDENGKRVLYFPSKGIFFVKSLVSNRVYKIIVEDEIIAED